MMRESAAIRRSRWAVRLTSGGRGQLGRPPALPASQVRRLRRPAPVPSRSCRHPLDRRWLEPPSLGTADRVHRLRCVVGRESRGLRSSSQTSTLPSVDDLRYHLSGICESSCQPPTLPFVAAARRPRGLNRSTHLPRSRPPSSDHWSRSKSGVAAAGAVQVQAFMRRTFGSTRSWQSVDEWRNVARPSFGREASSRSTGRRLGAPTTYRPNLSGSLAAALTNGSSLPLARARCMSVQVALKSTTCRGAKRASDALCVAQVNSPARRSSSRAPADTAPALGNRHRRSTRAVDSAGSPDRRKRCLRA